MPYIDPADRTALYPHSDRKAATAGELNFQITRLLDEYLQFNGLDYQAINDCMGALEGAKMELYRRVAAPYEDKKLAINTDVYETRGRT